MKILVVHNQDYAEKSVKTFLKGVEHLKKQGHNLKQDSDFRKDTKGNALEIKKLQAKIDKSLKDTDIVIAEVTNADAKVGFDIAKALAEKKIVVALQNENEKANEVSPIHGNKNKSLIIKKYNDKNITDVATAAVEEAKGKLDTKFILIISPEIDRYLDWAAQTKRMHKAQIVRNSIENSIRRDREYKTYLKG